MKLLTPNQKLSTKVATFVLIGQVAFFLLLWVFSSSHVLPKPGEILNALWDLIAHKGVIGEFLQSLTLCLKAIFYAVLLVMLIAYLSTIPIFKNIGYMTKKLRFLTTVGLSFLFMKLTHDVDEQKTALLVFGIYTFLIDSVISSINSIPTSTYNYARTLKMNEWQVLWHVVIVGRLSHIFESVRQNFAIAWMMLAMVENLCKSQGGIGVVLSDLNKWFKFEYVYAIQFLILFTGLLIDWSLTKIKGFLFPYTLLTVQK